MKISKPTAHQKNFSQAVLAKNPQLVRKCLAEDAAEDFSPPVKLKSKPNHEEKFLMLWKHLGGPALIRQFKFHTERKWLADFFHLASRTLIEIDGGIWIKGGHSTGRGIMRDMEKSNEAQFSGYRFIRVSPENITIPFLVRLIRDVEK